MILPDPIRERHRRALDKIAQVEIRLDNAGHYHTLIGREGHTMGFLRVSDAAEMIQVSRPTIDRLIVQGAVREVTLFPHNPTSPRFVSVLDLLSLPAVVLRSGDSNEVRAVKRRRIYDRKV